MGDHWMNHDEEYVPLRPRPRPKVRAIPPAARPDNIEARLAAIRQGAVRSWRGDDETEDDVST
jgi:hypothetical protein